MELEELQQGVKYDTAVGVMRFSRIEQSVFMRGWLRYPADGQHPAAVFLDALGNFGTYLRSEEVYSEAQDLGAGHAGGDLKSCNAKAPRLPVAPPLPLPQPAVDLFPPGDDWPEVEAGCGRSEAAPMGLHTMATFYHQATGEAGTVSLGGHVPRREGEG